MKNSAIKIRQSSADARERTISPDGVPLRCCFWCCGAGISKVIVAVFLIIFTLTLFGCDANLMTFKQRNVTAKQSRTYSIYVCGAVENEGYVHVFEGTDVQSVIFEAGYISQTVMPQRSQALIDANTNALILDYFDGQKQCACVNLNGGAITERRSIENVSAQVVEKIADYISANGKITDKLLLKQILGDDYADNFYKFYVSESDYEKMD